MKHYKLVYQQPYEYDDDSPEGIGDHDIGYTEETVSFEAASDSDAKKQVRLFLARGGIRFGSHPGSLPPGYYPRKFVSLAEYKLDRPVVYAP